jgi:hypothetical protein
MNVGEVPSKLLLLFYSCKPQYYVFLPEMNMVGDVQYVQHVNMGNAANDHHRLFHDDGLVWGFSIVVITTFNNISVIS